MKFLGNAPTFVIIYILFMLPTYYLPYLGSNSAVVGALGAAADAGVNPAFWPHLGSLLVLVVITWFRGVFVGKQWLIIFPLLASVFDLAPALNLIPIIPTVMHLLAIILGVSASVSVAPVAPVAPVAQTVSVAEKDPIINRKRHEGKEADTVVDNTPCRVCGKEVPLYQLYRHPTDSAILHLNCGERYNPAEWVEESNGSSTQHVFPQ